MSASHVDRFTHPKGVASLVVGLACALALCACGTRVTRTEVDESIDLSGYWNDTDSRVVAEKMIDAAANSDWAEAFGAARGRKPALIVGGILSGLATPTEAAALACLGSILVGRFVYKEFDPRALWPALKRTALSSSVVLILIAAANLFSWVITYENLPALAAQWIQAAAGSPALFLVLVTLALLVVGMILDPIPALILVVPVLLPVATGVYGISPFHFGVIVCLTLVMGLLTPPVGSALFTASTLSGVRAERLSLLLLPYLLVMLVVMALLIFFPFLTTALI